MSSSGCPSGQQTISTANLDSWYRNTNGINRPYLVYFRLASNRGVSTFSAAFASGTIDLDGSAGKLGLSDGNEYALELFHAERHTQASNFRVDTNFVFDDCGTIVP
jgi:hypothetical protein